MSNEVNDIWQHEFWQLGKVEDGRAMLLLTEDEYNSIRGAIAHREKMRSALEKIRDIYAGLDGMQAASAAEYIWMADKLIELLEAEA